MKVLVTGATGLVGTALVKALARDGHTVCRFLRRESQISGKGRSKAAKSAKLEKVDSQGQVLDVAWDPEAMGASAIGDPQGYVTGADAIVNLAGASVAGGKWTTERKMQLRASRIKTTKSLITALERIRVMPRVFLSASAIGYYGDRGDEILTEESGGGQDFLAKLACEWEAEALRAEALGMRVVCARFGIILAKQGGALPQMMRPFQLCVGGRLGSGRQWMSWVTLDDTIAVLRYSLENAPVSGAVNVVSPQPVRNEKFAKELGRALHRPAILPAPAFALRIALGQESADTMLLASERVMPKRLQGFGYEFQHADLRLALEDVLHGNGN